MFQGIITIFDNKDKMLSHLKKKSYEANMAEFQNMHGHYFEEMVQYVEDAENKEDAAQEIGECLAKEVGNAYKNKKGKISPRVQSDLNFFMIYYVFPAILLTEHTDANMVADGICEVSKKSFEDSNIGYTDYDSLYNSFREKIFGIF